MEASTGKCEHGKGTLPAIPQRPALWMVRSPQVRGRFAVQKAARSEARTRRDSSARAVVTAYIPRSSAANVPGLGFILGDPPRSHVLDARPGLERAQVCGRQEIYNSHCKWNPAPEPSENRALRTSARAPATRDRGSVVTGATAAASHGNAPEHTRRVHSRGRSPRAPSASSSKRSTRSTIVSRIRPARVSRGHGNPLAGRVAAQYDPRWRVVRLSP